VNGLKIIILTAIGIALIGTVTSTLAQCPQECGPFTPPVGLYGELNIGPTRVSNISYGSGTNLQNSGAGFNLNFGYKAIPYFGLEAGYTRYTTTKVNVGSTQLATVTDYAVDIAARGILPIIDTSAELFAKLGGAYVNSNLSIKSALASAFPNVTGGKHTTVGFYFGAGGDYFVTDHIAVNLQWQRSVGDSTTGALDLYSIGAAYVFG
jgi:opacity protein-like surface antigen